MMSNQTLWDQINNLNPAGMGDDAREAAKAAFDALVALNLEEDPETVLTAFKNVVREHDDVFMENNWGEYPITFEGNPTLKELQNLARVRRITIDLYTISSKTGAIDLQDLESYQGLLNDMRQVVGSIGNRNTLYNLEMANQFKRKQASGIHLAKRFAQAQALKVRDAASAFSRKTLSDQKKEGFGHLEAAIHPIDSALMLAQNCGGDQQAIDGITEEKNNAGLYLAQARATYFSKYTDKWAPEISVFLNHVQESRTNGSHQNELEDALNRVDKVMMGVKAGLENLGRGIRQLREGNKLPILGLQEIEDDLKKAQDNFAKIQDDLLPFKKLRDIYSDPKRGSSDFGNTYLQHRIDSEFKKPRVIKREQESTALATVTGGANPAAPHAPPVGMRVGAQVEQLYFERKAVKSDEVVRYEAEFADGKQAKFNQDHQGMITYVPPEQLTAEQEQRMMVEIASVLLNTYPVHTLLKGSKEKPPAIVIKAGPPVTHENANVLLAAVLKLKDKVPDLRNIKIVSYVSGCDVPTKCGAVKKFIETHLGKTAKDFLNDERDNVAKFSKTRIEKDQKFRKIKDTVHDDRKFFKQKLDAAKKADEDAQHESELIGVTGRKRGA